jgi:hypothetical protein
LGVWKLKRLPLPCLLASLFTALTALAFGAWKDMSGTINRPLFDTVGPTLILSTALLLSELWRDPPADRSEKNQLINQQS